MKVREDEIERADGSPGIFGVVEKDDFVLIVPTDDQGYYLVEQYRYPVERRLWEFPQGAWESQPEADPLVVARGELLEEAGIQAQTMEYLGHLYEAYGYSNQGFHVFRATGLEISQQRLSLEEQGLVMKHVGFAQFEEMVRTGQIKDAPTLAAFGLLQLHLTSEEPPAGTGGVREPE